MQCGVDAGQTFPQVPQFCESEFVLTQTPPQDVSPAAHPFAAQTPWLQDGADAGQMCPQAPQLCGSEFTAVHVPLQQAADVGQQA
jgi:hypothetical protein